MGVFSANFQTPPPVDAKVEKAVVLTMQFRVNYIVDTFILMGLQLLQLLLPHALGRARSSFADVLTLGRGADIRLVSFSNCISVSGGVYDSDVRKFSRHSHVADDGDGTGFGAGLIWISGRN